MIKLRNFANGFIHQHCVSRKKRIFCRVILKIRIISELLKLKLFHVHTLFSVLDIKLRIISKAVSL